MSRVKRGVASHARHKRLLALAEGYRHGRHNLVRQAKQAVLKAGQQAYRDRRTKKREARKLWIIKINAAARGAGLPYGQLMHGLKAAGVGLDRKALAHLAEHEPQAFAAVAEQAKAK